MTNKELAASGKLYYEQDRQLMADYISCTEKCARFNEIRFSDFAAQRAMLKEILGSVGENCAITAPFYCDYGYNITLGRNFYSNHNLSILDGAAVTIGDYVKVGPNCCFATTGHALLASQRRQELAVSRPITIEDDVWIGANVTVLMGVTIGQGSVIGAGSVVTKDIPAGVIAAGNPCRVIRAITDEDAEKYNR